MVYTICKCTHFCVTLQIIALFFRSYPMRFKIVFVYLQQRKEL